VFSVTVFDPLCTRNRVAVVESQVLHGRGCAVDATGGPFSVDVRRDTVLIGYDDDSCVKG
jgi:hypothetical protein